MVLTTGKAVEDGLFVFGMQCHEEHPVHSFIFDPRNPAYLTYNVLTQQELNEMTHQITIKPPKLNKGLRNYLNSYNHSSAEAILQQLFANQLPTLSNDEY